MSGGRARWADAAVVVWIVAACGVYAWMNRDNIALVLGRLLYLLSR